MLTATRTSGSYEFSIRSGKARLPATLTLPEHPSGLVLFAHGSGSGRDSPRNRRVSARLRSAGLGTLLFDLLTDAESARRRNVFEIPLLAERLLTATRWIRSEHEGLPLGWFGASTGAAAALQAAAEEPELVEAIVSRGGRPDLAENLSSVRVPTLLIVGENDTEVLELNRQAMMKLQGPRALQIIAGAGHLFEEGNSLEVVADYARHWFVRHLAGIGRHCSWPREGR
jgi:putative phosphoribosyl transferase